MTAQAPLLSVIVPVYRDGGRLSGVLQALAEQDAEFELIVVDNDPEGADALQALPDLPFPARLIGCMRPGSYAARNAGAAVARGTYLLFTDADCRPSRGWLAAMARALEAQPGILLAGPVLLEPGPDPSPWAIFDTVRGIPQAAFIRRGYAATANMACAHALFSWLGGFAEDRLSGGDAEFCRRARRQGVGLQLVPDAPVHHPARATRAELATKARRIKGGQVATGPRLRRVVWTLRSLVPPLREMAAYLRSPYPWRWRLVACQVRLKLWGVELTELIRLLVLRGQPERR